MASVLQAFNAAVPITLSDTVNIAGPKPLTDAIYVGTKGSTGTVVLVLQNDVTATFVGLTAGTILPVQCKRVNNTTTDASNLVALYQS